jgi:hypothetical protein
LTRRFHTYFLSRQQSARSAEAAHQKQLTGKLIAVRKGGATAKGYEFQYQGLGRSRKQMLPFTSIWKKGADYCALVDR